MSTILKIQLDHADGSVWYLDDIEAIRTVGLALPRNIRWKQLPPIQKLRNVYFALIAELAKETNVGYTKTDLHEAMKPILMRKFKDFPHYFTDGQPCYSTVTLTREGWIAIIEQLKVAANDIFGYIFK